MDEVLLSTGEVARRLGSSRQHVVDMCDRGDLPCVRVGRHRRIPASAVRQLLPPAPGLTRDQERSLWLHRVVVGALVSDPDATLAKARANLAAWEGVHRRDGVAARLLKEWRQLLDRGVDEVADVLTSRELRAVELRQNSPFAGVLDTETRQRFLVAFARHWRAEHADHRAA